MFVAVLRFELAFWFRRPLMLMFVVLFFLLAFFSTASDSFLNIGGTGQVHRNAPFLFATVIALLTAFGQVITTAIAGTAVLRDAQLGTQELLFTTRLTKSGYLLGRFIGAFIVMTVIYAAMPLGLLIGELMPWVDAEKMGPIVIWHVVQPFLLVAMPNLFFISALLFAVGALTRKLFAVYVTGIALLVVWQITQQITSNLDRLRLAALIDPFAMTAVRVVTRYWSTGEKNLRLLPLEGVLTENRALWLALALAIFAIVAVFFRLQLTTGTSRRLRREVMSSTVPLRMPVVVLRYDGRAWWRVLAAQARFHFRSIIREAPFQAIMVIGLVNTAIGLWYTSHPGESAHWPTTSEYAPQIIGSINLFLVILATLYGGELIWRERQLKADQISDAMPVPAWVTYGGKCVAVVMVLCMVPVAASLLGMVMQLAQGYSRLQPGLYLAMMSIGTLPTILALAAMAIGIHAIVNQKFVGHLLIIVYWVGTSVLVNLGFDHLLYQVGFAASFTYSDLNGWGPFPRMLLVLDGYTIAAFVIVACLGYLVLARGTVSGFATRWREAKVRWRHGGGAATASTCVVTIALGGVIFYNTNTLNHYSKVRPAEAALKQWELKYKPLGLRPQPRLIGVSLHHDLYPAERNAAWYGTLRAVNRTSEPIDTVFVNVPSTAARPTSRYSAASNVGNIIDSLSFSRPATLVLDDTPNGVRLYRMTTPLLPGDSLSIQFAGRYEPQGFSNSGFNNDVAANGSFMSSGYYPSFGYADGNELSSDDVRKRNGLKPKPRMMAIDSPAMRQNNYITQDADWITFDEVTCTAADQIAIAPGYLEREWTENGRHCFHYVMDRPILDFYTTLSARYTVTKENYKGVALEIYHLPEHTFALPSMMQASKDGLDYFNANFSPYLYRQYRIIEFPRYQGFAQSFPNTIPFSEAIGFIDRREEGDDKIDWTYFVTAHELAHQWWAHQVVGGNGQGSTLFSEGLAEYSALTVMEKRYGQEAAQKFLRRELDGYLRGRGNEQKKEVPALYVENQPYIHYQKGSLVFYALRDYIGEAAMNQALRAFIDRWALKGPPYPNARDLYAELDRVTPDSLKYVLKDLFEDITFYENKADTAMATKRPDGKYSVHLVVSAKKLKGDSLGNTTEVPIADYVDIGVFGEHVAGQKLGERLLVRKVHLTQAVTTLDLVVDKMPLRAGIDPYNKLIDRTPEDNVTAVKIGP
jgi:ABC-2 type transport system permease protein